MKISRMGKPFNDKLLSIIAAGWDAFFLRRKSECRTLQWMGKQEKNRFCLLDFNRRIISYANYYLLNIQKLRALLSSVNAAFKRRRLALLFPSGVFIFTLHSRRNHLHFPPSHIHLFGKVLSWSRVNSYANIFSVHSLCFRRKRGW